MGRISMQCPSTPSLDTYVLNCCNVPYTENRGFPLSLSLFTETCNKVNYPNSCNCLVETTVKFSLGKQTMGGIAESLE